MLAICKAINPIHELQDAFTKFQRIHLIEKQKHEHELAITSMVRDFHSSNKNDFT